MDLIVLEVDSEQARVALQLVNLRPVGNFVAVRPKFLQFGQIFQSWNIFCFKFQQQQKKY